MKTLEKRSNWEQPGFLYHIFTTFFVVNHGFRGYFLDHMDTVETLKIPLNRRFSGFHRLCFEG